MIWSSPVTRKRSKPGRSRFWYGRTQCYANTHRCRTQRPVRCSEYISFAVQPITRELRVAKAQSRIFNSLSVEQKQFLEFVLSKYIETGVEELDQEKLPILLTLKYQALDDAKEILGTVEAIRELFVGFQKHLYERQAIA